MKVADYIAQALSDAGLDTVFMITGGGAMHLNDAFARNKHLKTYYFHHEQSLSIAAEGYARLKNRPAIVNVTTGPGGINALNGVFGAYVDSIPMVIISGQVKRETTLSSTNIPLRQLGDQEAPIHEIAKPMVKYMRVLAKQMMLVRPCQKQCIFASMVDQVLSGLIFLVIFSLHKLIL